jgi:hypothetical protein
MRITDGMERDGRQLAVRFCGVMEYVQNQRAAKC